MVLPKYILQPLEQIPPAILSRFLTNHICFGSWTSVSQDGLFTEHKRLLGRSVKGNDHSTNLVPRVYTVGRCSEPLCCKNIHTRTRNTPIMKYEHELFWLDDGPAFARVWMICRSIKWKPLDPVSKIPGQQSLAVSAVLRFQLRCWVLHIRHSTARCARGREGEREKGRDGG